MSDGGRIDGIDLPSLSSFCVDGNSCYFSSFHSARFSMHSIVVLLFSGIDLPSMKSIYVGDGCFRESPCVEMTSEDELRHLYHRSSSIGITTYWLIRL